jgi:hypothetical protein
MQIFALKSAGVGIVAGICLAFGSYFWSQRINSDLVTARTTLS